MRIMVRHKISGDVYVVDEATGASCGPLHHDDQGKPLEDFDLDDHNDDFDYRGDCDSDEWAVIAKRRHMTTYTVTATITGEYGLPYIYEMESLDGKKLYHFIPHYGITRIS